MKINGDKYLGWISNIVIIYCFHNPVAGLLGSVGYNIGSSGLETIGTLLTFPMVPVNVGLTIYFVAFPIITLIVVVGSFGKIIRKERFTSWEKFRLIGTILIIIWLVLVINSLRNGPW